MLPRPLRWIALALVVATAFWLRTHDLAVRPMHADEANQAVKTGNLLETGRYAFDPHDHHGPTLYYAAVAVAWLRGEHSLASLSETSVRLVPAIAGTLGVWLLFVLIADFPSPANGSPRAEPTLAHNESPPSRDYVSRLSVRRNDTLALLAAAFLAVSPAAVYYSRDFIQETLLATFVLGAFVCGQRWWLRGTIGWAVGTGVCIGLAQATKITAPLFFVAATVALIAARPSRPASTRLARDVVLALVSAILMAVVFYTSFGTRLSGVADAFAAYGYGSTRAVGETGHEKPWWYYLRLLAWYREGGLVFQQIGFVSEAAAGVLLGFVLRSRALRCAAVYTIVLLLVFSITPYKTPWHVIHFVPALAALAAGAISVIPRRFVAVLLALAVLFLQWKGVQLAVFQRPADERNPYAYVHSSPDVLKIRRLADAALARSPGGVIRVIGEEYWPIPWYLRGIERAGYWSTPPDDCDGALVIVSASQAEVVRTRLHGSYRETLLGLRPGFLCVVFTPES
jgi:uncharacterized protein (TIGR03663 family)